VQGGQPFAVGVLGVLAEQPLDGGAVVCCLVGGDDHGDGRQAGVDGVQGAPVAVPDAHVAADGAVGDHWLEDAEVADAGQQILVDDIPAGNVEVDQQCALSPYAVDPGGQTAGQRNELAPVGVSIAAPARRILAAMRPRRRSRVVTTPDLDNDSCHSRMVICPACTPMHHLMIMVASVCGRRGSEGCGPWRLSQR
jgi:hypothetical protein